MTALVVLLLFASYPILAQDAGQKQHMEKMKPGMGPCGIPNLTAEQVSKIQKLKLEFEKGMLPLRQKMQTLNLDMKSLMAEGADLAKLGAKIDEMSKVRAEMQKKGLAHQQQIRSLLTDEQKTYFDRRACGISFGCGAGGHGAECGEGGCGGQGKMGHGRHGASGCGPMKGKCGR
jgi:Spy/CpxP family protein refolding chaperone